jgi:hypothetical protein
MQITPCHRPPVRSPVSQPPVQGGHSVTLWDEIAPPSRPPPIPVDAGHAAQGSVGTAPENVQTIELDRLLNSAHNIVE